LLTIGKLKTIKSRQNKCKKILILACVIYIIIAFIAGPLWPLQLLGGKARPLGYLLLIGWIILFLAGLYY
jgi:hypothetical protein